MMLPTISEESYSTVTIEKLKQAGNNHNTQMFELSPATP